MSAGSRDNGVAGGQAGGECAPGCCALAELGHGECAVVQASAVSDGDGALLKAMGLRPEARVRVCRKGEPCIVEVDGAGGSVCRVGIAREIARRVVVRREGVEIRTASRETLDASLEAMARRTAPQTRASAAAL